MTFQTEKGVTGSEVHATCDNCGNTVNTYGKNYKEASAIIRSKKWWITKTEEDWLHFCGHDCFKAKKL